MSHRLPVTEEQIAAAIELRDKLVRMAQDIEDQYGALVQLHRFTEDGHRELVEQFPQLGGYVTKLNGASSIIGENQVRSPQYAGCGYQLVGEGNDKFMLSATKP